MKSAIVAIALLGFAGTAQAQQQVTPSQLALQIDNAVNGLAQSVEALQAQVKQRDAKIKELEDKYEPKKSEPRNSEQNK